MLPEDVLVLKKSLPTFSIVIETDNLAIVDLDELFRCLDSLAAQGDRLHRAEGVFLADGVSSRKRIWESCKADTRRRPSCGLMQERRMWS